MQPGPPEEVQSLTQKYIWKVFKNILPKKYNVTMCEIMPASENNVNFKCDPNQYWGPIMGF